MYRDKPLYHYQPKGTIIVNFLPDTTFYMETHNIYIKQIRSNLATMITTQEFRERQSQLSFLNSSLTNYNGARDDPECVIIRVIHNSYG